MSCMTAKNVAASQFDWLAAYLIDLQAWIYSFDCWHSMGTSINKGIKLIAGSQSIIGCMLSMHIYVSYKLAARSFANSL